jgi:hypothetical protein
VEEIVMKVHKLPFSRCNKCVVLLLTLTYIHVGGDSPEGPIEIVCNREAEGIKRLHTGDLTFNQGGTNNKRGRVFFVVLESLHPVGLIVDVVLHTVIDGAVGSNVEPCSLEEVVDGGLRVMELRDKRKEGEVTMGKVGLGDSVEKSN